MNLIDKTIELFSPSRAFQRQLYRQGIESLKNNYDGARSDRFGDMWYPANSTGEQMDRGSRRTLMARARDLERNNDICEAMISGFERNVVGTGIRLQARVTNKDGTDNPEMNNQIEKAFKRWCRSRNCDVSGQSSFFEFQKLGVRRPFVDGDLLFIKTIDNTSRVPFKLQAIEADWLDTALMQNTENQNLIVSGVEVDQLNKPVAYHVAKTTLDGYAAIQSTRIPAEKVIHLYKRQRISQVRGVSGMYNILQRTHDIGKYMEAETVAQRVAACFSLFVETNDPAAHVGRLAPNPKDSSQKIDRIVPGMISYLKAGEKISSANPGRPTNATREFVELNQRLIGAGKGMSYEALSRDVSKVNYSSARHGHLEDRRTYTMEQQYLIEHFCREVYTEWLISAVLSGEIDVNPAEFWSNKDRFMEHEWITPGWQWVDPLKEVMASKESLKAGLTTLANEAAAIGADWQDLVRQRAKEQQFAESLGIQLDIDLPEGGTVDAQKVLEADQKSGDE